MTTIPLMSLLLMLLGLCIIALVLGSTLIGVNRRNRHQFYCKSCRRRTTREVTVDGGLRCLRCRVPWH